MTLTSLTVDYYASANHGKCNFNPDMSANNPEYFYCTCAL